MPDLFEGLKMRMGRAYLATATAFEEMKADTAVAWLDATERVEVEKRLA